MRSTIHGFPHVGARRELKAALERLWAGHGSEAELAAVARALRAVNWKFMREAGIDLIPTGDMSLYDHVLDTIALLGAVPRRYGHHSGEVLLETYFAMARGRQTRDVDVTAMEMTKWLDTNYHHIVPELGPDTRFALSSTKPFDEVAEAQQVGVEPKPVLLGPVTFLLLSKPGEGVPAGFDPLALLDPLLDVYVEVLARLADQGVEWVQIDEPAFATDRDDIDRAALVAAYDRLGGLAPAAERPRILVSTYFSDVGDSYPALASLPVEGLGFDFVRGPGNLDLLRNGPDLRDKTLFAGVIDGRNVWRADLRPARRLLAELQRHAAEVVVSTSCSLKHVPLDVELETGLDPEVRSWLAFAHQKVEEVVALARDDPIAIEASAAVLSARRASPRTADPAVRGRVRDLGAGDHRRPETVAQRRAAQRARLGLPVYPTTTIGSFPQTNEIRTARSELRAGTIDVEEYERRMREEIAYAIRAQERIGLDVLVHGEAERSDMVQHFAEHLDGFAITEHGWVQSFGSRYVRPPILFGDVRRRAPISVRWAAYAQSLTARPVKGMVTGPVTMLLWSFVRDDQPRDETCRQLALAIRDEVLDLEAAGIGVIQVDEPAIREGLPLHAADRDRYLAWAVECFRLATSGVRPETQIHTHMCYSDFGDVIDAIADLDADVASIEASRSRMALLEDFRDADYPGELGPGVYDIHSPRVPGTSEIVSRLTLAAQVLDPDRLWVNPDCGLKTRSYAEIEPALRNLVAAAQTLRERAVGA
jgi:5-methyltetrahydropteroyltriglutamate--homocysteine methyltransferase